MGLNLVLLGDLYDLEPFLADRLKSWQYVADCMYVL